MAVYTYDEEADALYVLLVPESDLVIDRTVEVEQRLHVDLDEQASPVGIEILYPTRGPVDLEPLRERYGLEVKLPFSFVA